MGNVTMYSCGEAKGPAEYLVLLGHNATTFKGSRKRPDFYKDQQQNSQLVRDYEVVATAMNQQTHPFKVHSSFGGVSRYVLERATEQQIADRARPQFTRFVRGLIREDGHFGDIVVPGAHPVIVTDGETELPPKRDPVYQVRPFAEALQRYPNERFFVRYDVSLDLTAFGAWMLDCRENFGSHATLVYMIERDCVCV